MADPFDRIPIGKTPIAAIEHTDRNFLAGIAQSELITRAIGKIRLPCGDFRMIKCIDAGCLYFDVQDSTASHGRQRNQRNREQDERDEAPTQAR